MFFIQHDVGGFDVPMYDTILMGGGQPARHLFDQAHDVLNMPGSLFQGLA